MSKINKPIGKQKEHIIDVIGRELTPKRLLGLWGLTGSFIAGLAIGANNAEASEYIQNSVPRPESHSTFTIQVDPQTQYPIQTQASPTQELSMPESPVREELSLKPSQLETISSQNTPQSNPSKHSNLPVSIESYATSDFRKDSDVMLLARIIYGEGRGCSDKERLWIGFSVINRGNDDISYNGTSIRGAMLHRKGYSTFWPSKDDKNSLDNYNETMNPTNKKLFAHCLNLADGILTGKYENPTGGANLYCTTGTHPNWEYADNVSKIISPPEFDHKFFLERKPGSKK